MTITTSIATALLLLPAAAVTPLWAAAAQEPADLTEDTTPPSGLQVVTLPASLQRSTVYKAVAVHRPALLHSIIAEGGATVAADSHTVTITEEASVDFATLLDDATSYMIEFYVADGENWFAGACFPLHADAWFDGKKAFTVSQGGKELSFDDAAAADFVRSHAILGYSIRKATRLRDVVSPIQESFASGTATTADSVSVYTDDKGNARKAYRAKSSAGSWTSARLTSGADILNIPIWMNHQLAVTRKKGDEASVVLTGDVTTGSRSVGVHFKTERVATGQLAGQSLESTSLGPQLSQNNGSAVDLPAVDPTAAWITCTYSPANGWQAQGGDVPALDGLLVIKRGNADDDRLMIRSPFIPEHTPSSNDTAGEP